MTDDSTTEYRLTNDVGRVVRAGLVLEGDETVELGPDEAAEYDDVLEPVDGDGQADRESADGDHSEADAEADVE